MDTLKDIQSKNPTIYLPIIDNGMRLSRSDWAFSLIHSALAFLHQYRVLLDYMSFPSPDGAMNIVSNHFFLSEADRMVVIDTDVVFKPDDLAKLLSHDEPLVFGLYPQKRAGLYWPVTPLPEDKNPFAEDGRGPLREVARCARGFMNLHRSVLEKMLLDDPEIEKFYDAGSGAWMPEFWRSLPGGHSEDFAFCDRARKSGFKILVDHRIQCRHGGSCLYPIEGTYEAMPEDEPAGVFQGREPDKSAA